MTPRPKQRRRRIRAFVVAAAATGIAAAGVAALADSPAVAPSPPPPRADVDAQALPDPVAPAFTPPKPRSLRSDGVATWAPVRRTVPARLRPEVAAPVVATLMTKTPEETDNIVLVQGREADQDGRLWVKVRIPALPNNVTAWVERSALGGYTVVRTRLEIDVEAMTLTLYRAGRAIFEAPVGVGTAAWPTPKGDFYVRNKLTRFASPFYGPVAFGTSARSRVLTDWPGGGFVGIHGTNAPELLPGRVSHGCVRLRNDDIVRLAELMPVGTPVTIT
ncbi:MAG TPA: L,D-transpeptidase [Gaiellaceae bacterium]|nr:L,D-transpeptidase [Gaiellaceae bacterium]